MPLGAAPMRRPDTRVLRDLLLRRQAELQHDWAHELVQPVGDDDLLPARQHLEDALVEVAHALQRLERGRFGACVACRGAVEWERLIANPAAARCWDCQQADEGVVASGRVGH
jgi:RNA polymerase-binding transcription factor DksA